MLTPRALEISCQAPIVRVPSVPATGSINARAAHVDQAPLPPQSVVNILEYPVLVVTLIDSKRYKMRLTHQVCGQHGRYWPVISSRVMYGPRDRVVPSQVVVRCRIRGHHCAAPRVPRAQSACISALEIACQTPRIGPAPAAATRSSITRAEHVSPAPLQAQSVANIQSEGAFTHRFEGPLESTLESKNVTKCVSRTRYAVSTGATGRFYHLVSCANRSRAGGPRGALAGGRQVP